MATARETRSEFHATEKIPYIGGIAHQITGAKLPSIRQVLQVVFFNMRVGKLKLGESAKLVTKEVQIFWEKARIPTKDPTRCAKKIIKLHAVWESIKKHPTRTTEAHKNAEKKFTDDMDNLFDIAHANALQLMKNEEDKHFLEMQRKEGRPGCMVGVDMKLAGIEQRAAERQQKERERKRKHHELMQQNGMLSQLNVEISNGQNSFVLTVETSGNEPLETTEDQNEMQNGMNFTILPFEY